MVTETASSRLAALGDAPSCSIRVSGRSSRPLSLPDQPGISTGALPNSPTAIRARAGEQAGGDAGADDDGQASTTTGLVEKDRPDRVAPVSGSPLFLLPLGHMHGFSAQSVDWKVAAVTTAVVRLAHG